MMVEYWYFCFLMRTSFCLSENKRSLLSDLLKACSWFSPTFSHHTPTVSKFPRLFIGRVNVWSSFDFVRQQKDRWLRGLLGNVYYYKRALENLGNVKGKEERLELNLIKISFWSNSPRIFLQFFILEQKYPEFCA